VQITGKKLAVYSNHKGISEIPAAFRCGAKNNLSAIQATPVTIVKTNRINAKFIIYPLLEE
jgi:hypothetical protein